MTKILEVRLADLVTAAPLTDFGSVGPGNTSTTSTLYLFNSGTDPIPSVRAHIEQASTADGVYFVTVGSIPLNINPQEVLTQPLAPGASIPFTERWDTPQNAPGALENASVLFVYDV